MQIEKGITFTAVSTRPFSSTDLKELPAARARLQPANLLLNEDGHLKVACARSVPCLLHNLVQDERFALNRSLAHLSRRLRLRDHLAVQRCPFPAWPRLCPVVTRRRAGWGLWPQQGQGPDEAVG